LNRNGGALGKTILFTVYDAASNDQYALATMKSLATAQNAPAAIFGRSPSDTSYATLGLGAPLLFSPTKSVGAQCAEKVIHMGGLLNQQLEPALQLFSQRARDAGQTKLVFYMVTPPEMSQIEQNSLRQYIQSMGDEVKGSMTVATTPDASTAVASIKSLMPTGCMVLNLLTDPVASVALLQAMRDNQMPAGAFPVLLSGISESDVADFGDLLSNHFASLSYFSVLGSPANELFLGDIAEWYGYDYIVTDQVQASFAAMVAWAAAVGKAGSFASRPVLKALWTTPLDTAAGQQSLYGSNYGSTIFRLGTLNSRNNGFRVVAEG
jgi:ABC-type branched-subunit amino acid transport system substrate-binding protein